MRKKLLFQNQSGFSLVEVLAAVLILSTILGVFLTFLPNAMSTMQKNQTYTQNIQAANSVLNFIQRQEFVPLYTYFDTKKNGNGYAIIEPGQYRAKVSTGRTEDKVSVPIFVNQNAAKKILQPNNKIDGIYIFLTASITDDIKTSIKNHITATLNKKIVKSRIEIRATLPNTLYVLVYANTGKASDRGVLLEGGIYNGH